MKRILIIEDEEIAAERLMKMVKKLLPDAEFSGPLDTVSGSVAYLQQHPAPDLIFLDIQLADGLSFEIFRQVSVLAPVIFTTAFDQYAIRAFELNSIDYLLKPVEKQKLTLSIDKFLSVKGYYHQDQDPPMTEILKSISLRQVNYRTRFLVTRGDVLLPLDTSQVAFFMAEDKLVFLYTLEGKKYIIGYTLDALESQLNPAEFFRINRNCILQSHAIVKVHSFFNYKLKVETRPSSGEDLIVSRSRVTIFKNWLGC